MLRFLSAQWCDELARGLQDEPSVAGITFTLQQVVTSGPDGDVSYWTSFTDGRASAGLGRAPQPDVTITQDYATAAELARGELVAQAAFMQGRLKVTGSMGSLLQNQAAVAAIGEAASALPTEF
jgi:putative sterol carrier protein